MASGDIIPVYGTAGDLTCTLASLATDANKLTGRESTALDLDSLDCTDVLLSGKITVGTSPTTGKTIEVWCIPSWDGTTWPDVFDGTDSAETITSNEIKNVICRVVASISTTNNSDRTYHFAGVSVASLFGGILPKSIVLFVTHDTAVNFNSTTGNHQLRYQPVTMRVAA